MTEEPRTPERSFRKRWKLVACLLFFALFYYVFSPLWDSWPTLNMKHGEAFQDRQPTPTEIEKGKSYLARWQIQRVMPRDLMFRVKPALWIIAGRTLDGMTKEEVVRCFGEPKECHPLCEPIDSCDDFLVFDLHEGSQCELGVEFRKGKVFNTFLEANL